MRAFIAGLAAAAAFVVTVPGVTAGGPANDTVVRVDDGLVRGVVAGDHRAFLGLPYAAPPVGALRWRAPRREASWSGVRDATTPGNECVQKGLPGQPPHRLRGRAPVRFLAQR